MKLNSKDALFWIAVFAVAKLVFHTVVNQQYGFHRDELQTLDDARHLAFGYVVYPPLTPFVGRIALELFGESPAGFRFFAAVAQSVAIVLAASMAKNIGGGRAAQSFTALGVSISVVSLSSSSLFQYVSFDFLWWVLIAWLVVHLIKTENERWWVAIGAVIGLGFLTKYTIVFFVVGLVVGFFATPLRKQIKGGWVWIGAVTALLIASPNLIWQVQNDFVSLDFLRSIHERDVRIGRTGGFLIEQLYIPSNVVTIPFWISGLVALFVWEPLRRFRILGWMAVIPFLLFTVAQGRSYYTGPLYPMLIAAGAVWLFGLLESTKFAKKLAVAITVPIMLIAGAVFAAVVIPIAPVGSNWWRTALDINGDLREEFGWPEMTAEVARIWETLTEDERRRTAIYASNYGEAGAINLYGPRYGLPRAISGVNSFWARGYGDIPPETVIVLGSRRERLEERFELVSVAGQIPNPLGIANEESQRPEIYICRQPKQPWQELWPKIRSFG